MCRRICTQRPTSKADICLHKHTVSIKNYANTYVQTHMYKKTHLEKWRLPKYTILHACCADNFSFRQSTRACCADNFFSFRHSTWRQKKGQQVLRYRRRCLTDWSLQDHVIELEDEWKYLLVPIVGRRTTRWQTVLYSARHFQDSPCVIVEIKDQEMTPFLPLLHY